MAGLAQIFLKMFSGSEVLSSHEKNLTLLISNLSLWHLIGIEVMHIPLVHTARRKNPINLSSCLLIL